MDNCYHLIEINDEISDPNNLQIEPLLSKLTFCNFNERFSNKNIIQFLIRAGLCKTEFMHHNKFMRVDTKTKCLMRCTGKPAKTKER
jgi:hypothetical protein